LTAECRQQRIGPLFGDNLFDHLPRQRLDVSRIGCGRIGHDRGRIAVDQHDLITLFTQRLTSLGAGIVKLAGLADHNRAAANDQDLLNVVASWHAGESAVVGYCSVILASAVTITAFRDANSAKDITSG
jgi:hypothetical protein